MRQKKIRLNLLHLNVTPALNIDNGCIFDVAGLGHLAAFDMDSHELHFQKCVDELISIEELKVLLGL